MERLTRDEVRLHVKADPRTLYELVSDVTRTPEWSREVVSCEWIDGATGPVVGARFKAQNKRRWFSWSNHPEVVVADPGREFAISRTETGGGTIVWRYRFEPETSGTTVVQSYEVVRAVPMGLHWMLRIVLGVRDLRADLHENMRASLRRFADIAERKSLARTEVAHTR